MTGAIPFIDLFAGIGGTKLGFVNAGFKCVFSNDIDQNCKKTFDLNFEEKLDISGIKGIADATLPNYKVLVAGFPCQSFSIAGHRAGFQDKGRGDLFFDIVRLLVRKPVQAFLLENVKHLVAHNKGKTFKTIVAMLSKAGYIVQYKVMNTVDYANLPQNRERVYMVGMKSNKAIQDFHFPCKSKSTLTLSDVLEDKQVDDKYYYNGKPLYEKLQPYVTKENTAYQWRRSYVREGKLGICPTLTANMGTGGHNVPIIKDQYGIRKLTPRECARLQGFDNSFLFPDIADSHLYKQIGNSVSIPVIEKIAYNIRNVL